MSHPRYADPTNEEPFQTIKLMLERDHSVAEFQNYLYSCLEPRQLAGAARYVLHALDYYGILRHTVSVRAQQMGVMPWVWYLPEMHYGCDPASGDESTVLERMVTMHSTTQTIRANISWLYEQIEQYEQRQIAAGHFSGGYGNQGGPSRETNGDWRGYSNQDDANRGGASYRMNRNWRENWRGSSDQDDSNRAGPSQQVNGNQPGSSDQVDTNRRGFSEESGGVPVDATAPNSTASDIADEHSHEPPRDPGPA